jgi:CO/xanthine dehydrogenase FAD-binding subunit
MLPYDFDYYRPDTLQEAVQIYDAVIKEGKQPYYYGGGTEIIGMSRVFNIRPDAVIDIKSIPECRGYGTDGSTLVFGAAATLNDIKQANLFALFSLTAGRIADHTIQCRLTLGGNLGATIIYRETLLPLLLADAAIEIAYPGGTKTVPIAQALSEGKRPAPGELIVRVFVDGQTAALPFFHIKKSKTEKIGYPLVTVCAIAEKNGLRLAASGLCAYPFRFADTAMNDGTDTNECTQTLISQIPAPVLNDLEGSSEYRLFVFEKTVEKIITDAQKGGLNA